MTRPPSELRYNQLLKKLKPFGVALRALYAATAKATLFEPGPSERA